MISYATNNDINFAYDNKPYSITHFCISTETQVASPNSQPQAIVPRLQLPATGKRHAACAVAQESAWILRREISFCPEDPI